MQCLLPHIAGKKKRSEHVSYVPQCNEGYVYCTLNKQIIYKQLFLSFVFKREISVSLLKSMQWGAIRIRERHTTWTSTQLGAHGK